MFVIVNTSYISMTIIIIITCIDNNKIRFDLCVIQKLHEYDKTNQEGSTRLVINPTIRPDIGLRAELEGQHTYGVSCTEIEQCCHIYERIEQIYAMYQEIW